MWILFKDYPKDHSALFYWCPVDSIVFLLWGVYNQCRTSIGVELRWILNFTNSIIPLFRYSVFRVLMHLAMVHSDKPWLAMVHSDKSWPLLCDDVILIFLYRNTGSLWLWEFITFFFASFSSYVNDTLAIMSWGKRNSITGNVQALIHVFNKDMYMHFL